MKRLRILPALLAVTLLLPASVLLQPVVWRAMMAPGLSSSSGTTIRPPKLDLS